MLLVHKIELKPSNKQSTYFAKACGIARFAYNWALGEWKKQYIAGHTPTEAKLRKELNVIKAKEFPWMLEVTKVAPQQAIKNLGVSFKNFFAKQSKYPRFKKKGIHDSFRADNGPPEAGLNAALIYEKQIKLPRIGWVKLKEALRFKGQIKSVVISRKGNRWFAAISVETDELPHVRKNQGTVGIDLGINALVTQSDGEVIPGPKAYNSLLSRIKLLCRRMSRKTKGSVNFKKAKTKLRILHAKISNIRQDHLHKLTTELVLNNILIGIEDLNVKGMAANRRLSRSIMDQSFYEFRRQLTYKSKWYGTILNIADRFFPSSKLCNVCGAKNTDLKLQDRNWACSCGVTHDRDINAAINLANLAISTVSSTGALAMP